MTTLARVTDKDPDLPHQIVLKYTQHVSRGGPSVGPSTGPKGGGTMCAVTCNCREPHGTPIGFVGWGKIDEAWRLYEDPENHDQRAHPYRAGDRGKQRVVVVP